jgi:hypothetical protein
LQLRLKYYLSNGHRGPTYNTTTTKSTVFDPSSITSLERPDAKVGVCMNCPCRQQLRRRWGSRRCSGPTSAPGPPWAGARMTPHRLVEGAGSVQGLAAAARAGGLQQQAPIFSFGVITDVQYADIPDGHSFHGVPRCQGQGQGQAARCTLHAAGAGRSLTLPRPPGAPQPHPRHPPQVLS